MKKATILLLGTTFLLVAFTLQAQDNQRTKTIRSDKYRAIIENYRPHPGQTDANRDAGTLIYFENFDSDGPAFPAGWDHGSISETCMWAVDNTPDPPGYYSPDYSLNFNNGVDYNCGYLEGYATSPLINVGGQPFTISLQYISITECGTNNNDGSCGWDETWLTVYDENDIPFFETNLDYLAYGNDGWVMLTIPEDNIDHVQNIRLEFFFITYDNEANDYPGPFIDDLGVSVNSTVIPLSGWSIAIGIFLIVGFTVWRFRKSY